jgi:hypothetical protein
MAISRASGFTVETQCLVFKVVDHTAAGATLTPMLDLPGATTRTAAVFDDFAAPVANRTIIPHDLSLCRSLIYQKMFPDFPDHLLDDLACQRLTQRL